MCSTELSRKPLLYENNRVIAYVSPCFFGRLSTNSSSCNVVALTIQKQLATCDLTNDFTKLGNAGSRLDWTSSARIKADDLVSPTVFDLSTGALFCLQLQQKQKQMDHKLDFQKPNS